MLRNSSSVKAADIYQKKTKAKVIDWEPRKHSRGVRDVPVEVIATASQTRPRKKASRQPRAQNNDTLQGEAAPQPMDIDEMSRTAPLTSFSLSYFVLLVPFPSVTPGRFAHCLLTYRWTVLAFSRDFHTFL